MDTCNNIKKYLFIINEKAQEVEKSNPDLLDFVINEVMDRVKLYLNSEKIPQVLERILAKIVSTGLTKTLKDMELSKENETDHVITSISDNGQSISFSNEVTKYFVNASDEELFTGFTGVLNRYRRIKVVYSKCNEENNE